MTRTSLGPFDRFLRRRRPDAAIRQRCPRLGEPGFRRPVYVSANRGSVVARALVFGVAVAAASLAASSAGAVTLTRGPYLQRLDTASAMIAWNTDVAAPCAVAVRAVDGAPRIVTGATGKVCALTVNGLEPGTVYGYTPLAGAAAVGAEASFRTDHPALPYTFLVFGDSGSGRAEQMAVRDRMLATHADLIVHTGDMIYPEAETAAWNPKYFAPYEQLLRKLVLWPCLGNHDDKDGGKSWRAAFFTPANNALRSEEYYSFDHGNAHFVVLDSNESLAPGSVQYVFLEQSLAASTATWNFVFFHHTIYSGGEHGSALGIQESLVPLFDAYEVDVVFMGHDHDYERTWPLLANQIVEPGTGTIYVTTGGGGAELREVIPSAVTAYAESAYHFVRVAVAGQSLRLDMIRTDGTVADSMSLLDGPPPACGDGVVNQVGEACDGADDVACPGRCDASCTCPALCGDGVRQAPVEECDWLDDAQCPGLCIADCTCADSPGSLDLAPVADTFIESGTEATCDHGAERELLVDAAPNRRIVYFKFDLNAVTQPIAAAKLGLSCTNASDDGGTVHPVADSSWVEGVGRGSAGAGGPGLKWADVDTNGDGLLDGADTSPYLPAFTDVVTALGPVALDTRYLVDLTSALEDARGLVTVAMATGSSQAAGYASRENAAVDERPLLHLDFDLECRSDAECDDGVLCNGAEQCLRGHCAAGPEEDCDDGSACTVDACDVVADECLHDLVADGLACDDGDRCTQVDECRDGVCIGGALVLCGGPGPCHGAEVCDPATGQCVAPPAADGTPCDDGNGCTRADACERGVCVGGDPVSCVATDACHAAGVCDPATGLCSNPPLPEGTPCEDGNACTAGERCQALRCVGGTPMTCVALDQCHLPGVCEPATGECTNVPAADGAPCEDGDPCTVGDGCRAGTCIGGPPMTCTPPGPCHTAVECDPATGQCTSAPLTDGAACDDGSACTRTDACLGGTCTGGDVVVCPAPAPCHAAGICNPATGACASAPVADGTPCDDGNACTRTDTCRTGSCVGGAPVVCGAPGSCHAAGVCDPVSGECASAPLADGTACDDGNACTQGDACQAGTCVGGAPVACPAPAACRAAGVCNPATGQCSSPPLANGTVCDDGNACTRSDACQGGSCIGGQPVVCTVSGQCEASGVCDPATGACTIIPKADGVSCSDGNPCTQGDACRTGVCVSGPPMTCPPLDQCHGAGTCNPTTGQCTHPAKPSGAACDDGNPCTLADTCQGGVCVPGPAMSCAPLDQCHQAGTCNRTTGQCSNPPKVNGALCDDGNPCTQADACLAGACVGGPPVVCVPLDACHRAGACDPATGCSQPAAPDGTLCDDASVCTRDDACQGGLCVGVPSTVCVPLDQCHDAGVCDPATG